MSGVDESLLWDFAVSGVSGLSHGWEGEFSSADWKSVVSTIVSSSVVPARWWHIDESCRNHFLLIVTIEGDKYMVSGCPGQGNLRYDILK